MEKIDVIIIFVLFILLITVVPAIGGLLKRKAREAGAERSQRIKLAKREASSVGEIKVWDVITVGVTAQQASDVIAGTKLLNRELNGSFTAKGVFSKEDPFIVKVEDLGSRSRVQVAQYQSKKDSIDGDIYWSTIARALNKATKKVDAEFRYEAGTAYQVTDIAKGALLHRRF